MFPCSHFSIVYGPPRDPPSVFDILRNQQSNAVNSSNSTSSVFLLLVYPPVPFASPRLASLYLIVRSVIALPLAPPRSIYSSSEEPPSCQRWLAPLPIFRNSSKRVVNHICTNSRNTSYLSYFAGTCRANRDAAALIVLEWVLGNQL